MSKRIGAFTLDVNKDDRGRIVAEVWHTESGKTLAISEVDSEKDAEHCPASKRLSDLTPTRTRQARPLPGEGG